MNPTMPLLFPTLRVQLNSIRRRTFPMRQFLTITIRTTTVLALVVGMPLLALPQVSAGLGEWAGDIYDDHFYSTKLAHPSSTVPPMRVKRDNSQVDESVQWQADGDEDRQPSVDLRSEKPTLDIRDHTSAEPRNPLADHGAPHPLVRELRHRLLKLGAQYMRLDEVADQPSAYHFTCLMPVDARSVYCREFTVTDADPVRAMERVLSEIEQWRELGTSL